MVVVAVGFDYSGLIHDDGGSDGDGKDLGYGC